jgi:AraC family transcriptional regulator of adaptative response/methylated-DNA-[protein]-cysteine methyltransferase
VRNGSGFGSASGFREAFTRIFGDAPTTAKERGCLFAERIETPLGTMLAVRAMKACGCWSSRIGARSSAS